MPPVVIYLNNELYEFIKKDKSKICQQALKEYKEKLQQQKKHKLPPTPLNNFTHYQKPKEKSG